MDQNKQGDSGIIKFHYFMESLKVNKDIKDLPRYVGKYVHPGLRKKQDQTLKTALDLLEAKYGRSRTEKIKECGDDILRFQEDQYEEDSELILALREIRQRDRDLNITQDKWFAAWMLSRVRKRKKIDSHEL